MNSSTVISAVDSVTKKWTKQRKAEERGKSRATRQRSMTISYRVTIRDAAFGVMEAAYLKASANGTYPALARQIMYAARPEILHLTGESSLDSQYFTQVLLPEYMEEHGCDDWNVAYDARGNFHEPHTKKKVPLGTIDVRGYLRDITWAGDIEEESDFDDSDRRVPCITLHDAIYSQVDKLEVVEAAFREVFDTIGFRFSTKREVPSERGAMI